MQGMRLEGLTEYFPPWADEAQCKDIRPEVFQRLIEMDGNSVNIKLRAEGVEYNTLKALGREVCANCIVAEECGEFGRKYNLYGMWNGLTYRDRKKARRRR